MPDRPRLATVGVVCAILVGAAAVGGVTTAASSHVVVQSATVEPTVPRVGEDVTITATIRNFESSPSAAEIRQVTLRQNNRIVESVDDPGTIGPGGTVTLPITTAFESTGQKRLTVWVYGESSDGDAFNVKYPVTLNVEERDSDVQLSLSSPDEPSTETRVNVTMANGATTNVSNLRLTLSGPNATLDDPERIVASLGPGTERVVEYDVTFASAGRQSLTATLDYRDGDGDPQSTSVSRTFGVDPADVDAELDAAVVRENGTARIDASLTNFGNVPLERVRIRAESGGETVARKLVADVPREATREVSIDESRLPAGEVRLRATYEAVGERHETATTVDFTPTTDGNISLTGIEIVPTGTAVRLVGSASNTGETPVTGAVVAVVGTERVTPIAPTKDYFVGNVPAGEFTSFELTARLAGNRTDVVPIRVSYIAGGERYERVVEVSITDGSAGGAAPQRGSDAPDGPPGGGGFLGLGRIDVVGILLRLGLLVAIGGGVVYWWQRRRRPER
jgi:hypothetical protein